MPQAADGKGNYSRKYLERERAKFKGMTDAAFDSYLQEKEMTEEVVTKVRGRVKWFNAMKGYGFITMIDSKDKPEVFVHYSSIVADTQYKSLKEHDLVEFNLIQAEKGPQAQEVTIVKE